MTTDQIKALVDDHVELIAVGNAGFRNAFEKATKFLIVVAILSEYKMELEKRKSKVSTLRDAFYAHAIINSDGKNAPEKKAQAESNKEYTDQRERTEELDSEIYWVRSTIEIFNNAHVLYRQMAKGD